MSASGSRTMLKDEELSTMLTRTSSWENSSEVKLTVKASTSTMTVRSTLGTGRTTCSMVRESRLCPMAAFTMARSKEDAREA